MKLCELFDSSPEYQNYKVRQITANQNRVNNASRRVSQSATMAAHTNHVAPIYATQVEWDNWIRMGGIEYARQMDVDRMNDPRVKQTHADTVQQQNYVRNRLQQQRGGGMSEAYDPNDPDSWMDDQNRKNAQYAQTHYSQPADDTLSTDGTFSDSMAYANHKSRTNSAQRNRVDFAAQNARYKADLSANSQHTSPVYATPEEWNLWVRQGGLQYAQQMDLGKKQNHDRAKHSVDYAERQAYIKSLEMKQKLRQQQLELQKQQQIHNMQLQKQRSARGQFSNDFRQHFQRPSR